MNSKHIHDILSSDSYCSSLFVGVYARDEFCKLDLNSPKFANKRSLAVINLDESHEPGSHWVVVDKDRDTIFYFDSYGFYPLHKDLLEVFYQSSKVLFWNGTVLQGIDSTACGHYCIIYCLLKARNYSFEDIVSILYSDDILGSHRRDHIIFDFVNFLFPKILSSLKTNIHEIYKFIK